MKKPVYTLIFFSLIAFNCIAQNTPVHEYLMKQDFPDSVRNVPAETLQGETITLERILSKYKGKTIVLDVWASWCRDCIVGVPKLNDIIKRTADENIVYVFLSVDDNAEKWRLAIERFKIPGEHFRIKAGWKNPFANYIALDWVPRYMILNDSGRVVKPKEITAEGLDELLGK
ncbi:MAG TPA: TlpA disulfide reductase family protein [Chryseolinea sp.]|nr:TlpA disulfide reductase family protein [Chryseolinea sp.]HPM29074.1 TlpA disulfide reductase family protein [Chryseolinea sp.]